MNIKPLRAVLMGLVLLYSAGLLPGQLGYVQQDSTYLSTQLTQLTPLGWFGFDSAAYAQATEDESQTIDQWGREFDRDREPEPVDIQNPLSLMDSAAQALPIDGTLYDDPQEARQAGLSASISIVALLTIITLAPAILVMCTSFTRVIIVLALLRQAIGTQSLPPSQVLLGLSLFVTLVVMAPTIDRLNAEVIEPMQRQAFSSNAEAWEAAKLPVRDFMIDQIEYAGNEDGVIMLLAYRGVDVSDLGTLDWNDDVDMITLVPAFVLSELKVAFLMGFRLYLPFLVIDMVVSSVLISMGMMMLPPVFVSLPFKLLLFVLVDGWRLVVGSLLDSFVLPPEQLTGLWPSGLDPGVVMIALSGLG